MEGDDLHECTEFDQLNTCVECGAPKHRHTQAQFTGGAGAKTQPLSDEDYHRQMRKLQRGDN
jgi:hypothetical protein